MSYLPRLRGHHDCSGFSDDIYQGFGYGLCAAADIPLTQTLMHKHQCAGRQHIRNLADEDEEHGQLIHDQRHGDGNQHARNQRQTIPEIHTHEHIGGAACQRTGGHIEAVRHHGDRGGDGEHGGDGHGTQNVDPVIERHEAAALDEGKVRA